MAWGMVAHRCRPSSKDQAHHTNTTPTPTPTPQLLHPHPHHTNTTPTTTSTLTPTLTPHPQLHPHPHRHQHQHPTTTTSQTSLIFANEAVVVVTRLVVPFVVQPRPDVDTVLRTTLDVVVRLSFAPERELHAPLSLADRTPPIPVFSGIVMIHTPSRPQVHVRITSSFAVAVSCV